MAFSFCWRYKCLPDAFSRNEFTASVTNLDRYNIKRMPGNVVYNATLKVRACGARWCCTCARVCERGLRVHLRTCVVPACTRLAPAAPAPCPSALQATPGVSVTLTGKPKDTGASTLELTNANSAGRTTDFVTSNITLVSNGLDSITVQYKVGGARERVRAPHEPCTGVRSARLPQPWRHPATITSWAWPGSARPATPALMPPRTPYRCPWALMTSAQP